MYPSASDDIYFDVTLVVRPPNHTPLYPAQNAGDSKSSRGLRQRYQHTDEEHLKADRIPFHAILPQHLMIYSIEPSKAAALTCIKGPAAI